MDSCTWDGMATMAMTGMPVMAETSSMAEKFFGSAMATVSRPLMMDSGSRLLRRHRSSGTSFITLSSIWYSLRSTKGKLRLCARASALARSVSSSIFSSFSGISGLGSVMFSAACRGTAPVGVGANTCGMSPVLTCGAVSSSSLFFRLKLNRAPAASLMLMAPPPRPARHCGACSSAVSELPCLPEPRTVTYAKKLQTFVVIVKDESGKT